MGKTAKRPASGSAPILPTAEEDAAITAAALSDPDNPPFTDEDFAAMRPVSETHPWLADAARKRKRQ